MLSDRFRSKVWIDLETHCWLWTGGKTRGGYGALRVEGAFHYAHRLSYQEFWGKIPDGLQIDHLCRVRHCVNPDHLEPVTQKENLARGNTLSAKNALVSKCPQGHQYDSLNTYTNPNSGKRACRACQKIHGALHRQRQKERS